MMQISQYVLMILNLIINKYISTLPIDLKYLENIITQL